MPDAEDVNPDPAIVEVELEARVQPLPLADGGMLEMWTYNGLVPGPLISVHKGDLLVVHFTNHLPEPTTIHWHGLRVPAAMDGSEMTQLPVQPGETLDYHFTIPDAGTYWYHPHYNSAAQLGFGLYGAIVVQDPAEPAHLGDDLVLVLSDVSVTPEGTLAPADQSGWLGDYFGREGGLLLVNGRRLPQLKARAGVPQRWRVINASRSRYQRFSIPGQSMVRIGGDNGLIEHAVDAPEVILAPGERAEVSLIPRAQPDGPVMVQWLDFNRFDTPRPFPPKDMLVLDVVDDGPAAPLPDLPVPLRVVAPVDTQGAATKVLELGEKVVDGVALLTINGMTHEEAHPLHAQVNTVEVWEVFNNTDYNHPFHLHGFFFQVLDVDGVAPSVLEWRDTVNLHGHQRMHLAVVLDDRAGMWMYHCHILDHAGMGMMGMLMVE